MILLSRTLFTIASFFMFSIYLVSNPALSFSGPGDYILCAMSLILLVTGLAFLNAYWNKIIRRNQNKRNSMSKHS